MRFFGKNLKTKYGKADGGYTLVELVVSMALTAILATAVASIMFPIVSIFMDMQKLSRAQMVADTVTDALRKECAAAYVTGVADIKLINLSEQASVSTEGEGLTPVVAAGVQENMVMCNTTGNALVFRLNEGYAEILYWNTGVSTADYGEVLANNAKNPATSAANSKALTSRAVYRLFPNGTEMITEDKDMPAATRPGYLHYGYYETTMLHTTEQEKEILVFSPVKAYDYTNPFSVNAYNGFTISVSFSDLTFENRKTGTSTVSDKRPVYVIATVNVYEGSYEKQSTDTLICSRQAVLCFAEDNRRDKETE